MDELRQAEIAYAAFLVFVLGFGYFLFKTILEAYEQKYTRRKAQKEIIRRIKDAATNKK
jgi:hypothetical protein